MASLLDALSLQWDLWNGPYRAFFPTRKEERRICQALITKNRIGGEEDFRKEGEAQLAACQDTRNGDLIACLHLNEARPLMDDPASASHFNLHFFDENRLDKVGLFTGLSVHPKYTKTAASLVLMSHCFIELLKAGGQAVLMSCDTEHYSLYKRLGMRPIGPLQKSADGTFRIPMICLPDQEYLSIINSPVLSMIRGIDFTPYREICQWYYQLVREHTELQTGSAFYPDAEKEPGAPHPITDGMSEQGQQAFLKRAMVIHCREGEVLINEDDGGKSFGYVRQGILKVVIGKKTVVLLGEGDIFGEIAFILRSKRTAQVIAASPDTEVVLFDDSAINFLEKADDRAVLWQNLARVLAQRVVVTNKLLD